jgi:sigma54-dependent transcription regulator
MADNCVTIVTATEDARRSLLFATSLSRMKTAQAMREKLDTKQLGALLLDEVQEFGIDNLGMNLKACHVDTPGRPSQSRS